MSKHIKWKFKSTDIYFVSPERNLTRDVMRQRERLKLKSTAKIEIINEFFTDDNSTTTGCTSCGSSSNNNVQSALSMDSEATQTDQETLVVSSVYDLLDEFNSSLDSVGDKSDSGDTNGGDSFSAVDSNGQVD